MTQDLISENAAVYWKIVIQQQAQFYVACAGTPNRSSLM